MRKKDKHRKTIIQEQIEEMAQAMSDREKIIKIIENNGTYNGRSLSFDYYVIQPDDLADALIEAGYGDVRGWKRRAEVAEQKATAWKDCANKWQKYYKEQAEHEIAEGE